MAVTNTIIPLFWNDLLKGWEYLLYKEKEGHSCPKLNLNLALLDYCEQTGCFFALLRNKITTSGLNTQATYLTIDDSIDLSSACEKHLLPLNLSIYFNNSREELDILLLASSLISLEKYRYPRADLGGKGVQSSASLKDAGGTIRKLKNVYIDFLERDNPKAYFKYKVALSGQLDNIDDLYKVTSYLLRTYRLSYKSDFTELDNLFTEFRSIAHEFTMYNKVERASNYNYTIKAIIVKEFEDKLLIKFMKQVRASLNSSFLELNNEVFELQSKNYHKFSLAFSESNKTLDNNEFYLAIEREPNILNILNYDYIDNFLTLAFILQSHGRLECESVVEPEVNLFTQRAIIKLSARDYFLLRTLLGIKPASEFYPVAQRDTIMDAVTLWSSDFLSPFYTFDDSYKTMEKL